MQTPETPDQHACVRVLARLRCGVAPCECLHYLSVGMHHQLQLMGQCLGDVASGHSRLTVVQESYGGGKSQMLQLISELASRRGLATAYLAHNHISEASFHRPSILLKHILRALEWNHLEADLRRYTWEMNSAYSYVRDRRAREELPDSLSDLAQHLAPRFRGLAVIVDEVENMLLLHHRSLPIAVEVLVKLCGNLKHMHGVWFVLAVTPEFGDALEGCVRSAKVVPPTLTEDAAADLTKRIGQLHARAYDWMPPRLSDGDCRRQYAAVVDAGHGSSWRAVVQRSVAFYDLEHLRTLAPHGAEPMRLPRPSVIPPGGPARPSPADDVPPLRKQAFEAGDTVEVMSGPMRGYVCQVAEVWGGQARLTVGDGLRVVQIGVEKLRRVHGRQRDR